MNVHDVAKKKNKQADKLAQIHTHKWNREAGVCVCVASIEQKIY